MAIIINLDVMLARHKMKSKELAAYVGITEQNLSLLKSGKVKGIRFSTLENICAYLNCQPGDILEYRPDSPATDGSTSPAQGKEDRDDQ
ncbi:MAG: helix-turn-helix transcriptional regulator [Betaproteobacteria bacterium]